MQPPILQCNAIQQDKAIQQQYPSLHMASQKYKHSMSTDMPLILIALKQQIVNIDLQINVLKKMTTRDKDNIKTNPKYYCFLFKSYYCINHKTF